MHPFELPRLRTLARHALPHLVEASLVPLALFYGVLWLAGMWGALIAALGWCYLALGWRLATRRRVPGLLVIGAMGLTARTAVAFASGSLFVYFLQPTLTTVLVAGAFLLSVPAGRPLAERLAADFFPLPPELLARDSIRRVFARISLLWAFVNLANAALSVVLLVTQPVQAFPALKAVASLATLAFGVGLSTRWFTTTLRRHRVSEAAAATAA